MNYGELKERLLETLGRPAMPLAYTLANESLDRRLRIRAMENTATVIAAGGVLPLPDDFIEPKSLKDASGCFYAPTSHEAFASLVGRGGPPKFVLGESDMALTVTPADGAEFSLVYFGKLAVLSADGDTNAALTAAPEAFVYSVLSHHAKLIRDGGALQFWQGEAQAAIMDANKADKSSRFSGGALTIEPQGTVV